MSIKNYQLQSITEGLSEVMATGGLRPKFAFKLLKIYKHLFAKFEEYANFRNDKVFELAEKDEDGNPIYIEGTKNVVVSQENIAALNELDESEVEGVTSILLSELEDNLPTIKIETLIKLGNLVVEDAS